MKDLKSYDAVKGLIFYQNKVLIIEPKGHIGGRYDLPGGRKINREESDEAALKREIKEEVGIEIKIHKLIDSWTLDIPEKGIHLDGKTYQGKTDSDKVVLGEKQFLSYMWISIEELMKLDIPDWFKESISKI